MPIFRALAWHRPTPRLEADLGSAKTVASFKHVRAEHYFADGGTMIALGRYSGVHHQTGKTLDAAFAHVQDAVNGKIAAFASIPARFSRKRRE